MSLLFVSPQFARGGKFLAPRALGLVSRILKRQGVDLEQVGQVAVAPEGTRALDLEETIGALTLDTLKILRGRVEKELKCSPLLSKLVIVPFGKEATRLVLGIRRFGVARGFIFSPKEATIPKRKKAPKPSEAIADARAKLFNLLVGRGHILPTIDPSFAVTAHVWGPVLEADLCRACRVARGQWEDDAGAGPNAIGGPELLSSLGPDVSLDIETDGIDVMICGILCVGLGCLRTGKTVCLWPWTDAWSGELRKFLAGRGRVVGHNLHQFDLLVLRNHGVIW